MSDQGQSIPVILNFSPVQTDEELKSNSRMVLGYLSAKFQSDADITVTIYFKRDDDMEWENTAGIVMSASEGRYFGQLPQGLSVIDYYVTVESSPSNTFWISSLKILMKSLPTGKFG
jgi:hypothetical protein